MINLNVYTGKLGYAIAQRDKEAEAAARVNLLWARAYNAVAELVAAGGTQEQLDEITNLIVTAMGREALRAARAARVARVSGA